MDDTTALSYWLNWRFFLCALWVVIAIIVSVILIAKYEVFNKKRSWNQDDELDTKPTGILYEDETWRTSFEDMHPAWLLCYRLLAFCLLLAILIFNLVIAGAGVLFYYTQWTFGLVTFYFGLASSLSIYGCYQYCNEARDDDISHMGLDTEQGSAMAPLIEESFTPHKPMKPSYQGEIHARKTAGIWGFSCQIVFQLRVTLHSVNAVLLLIDVILNRLRFPFFRLAYFAIWTCIFVIFQWILHACVSIRWPYVFLDLSSPYVPIWYLGVGLIHLPAFGIFALIVKWKELLLSRFSENITT